MGQGASKSARKQEEGLRCMYQAQEHLQAQNYGLARTSCTQGIKLLEEAVTFAEAADAGMYKKSLAQAYLEQGDIFSALKDKDKAQESYGKAAKLGNVQAQEKLAVLMNPVSTSSPNIQNVQAREKPAVSAEPVSASGSETKLEVGNLVVSFSSPNIQNVQAREKPAVSAEPVSASSSETKLEVGNLVVSFVTQPSWPSNLPQVFLQTLLPDAQEDKLDSKAEIKNTQQLARFITSSDEKNENYERWCERALDVIAVFANDPLKLRPAVIEVTALAAVQNKEMHAALLSSLLSPIKSRVILNVALIDGLATTIRQLDPTQLDADDLMQVLILLQDCLTKIHAQGDGEKLYHIVRALSRLLDAMVDINLKGISRTAQHEPLYNYLEGLATHSNFRLAFQARYAQQALLRIPHDEGKLRSVLRRLICVGNGINNLKDAVTKLSPKALYDAYKSFYEATKAQKSQHHWYDELRVAELFLEADQLVGYEFFVKNAPHRHHEDFMSGVIQHMRIIVMHHQHLSVRQEALIFLSQIWQVPKAWGEHVRVQSEVVKALSHCALHPQQELRDKAQSLLKDFQTTIHPKQKEVLKASNLPDFRHVHPRTLKSKKFPTRLLDVVLERGNGPMGTLPLLRAAASFSDTAQTVTVKLQKLRENILKSRTIQLELATYIPVSGTYRPHDTDVFDLETRVQEYLQSEHQTVLLLLGNAGGGKSTFNRYLERRLWENYQTGHLVPVFISLPNMEKPETDLLNEHFRRQGFTDKEISVLKANYRFVFILDGYDEINKLTNLHLSNHLNVWQGKTIIACRTEYLHKESGDYSRYFVPYHEGEGITGGLLELVVAPFSDAQIETYIRKYIELHPNAPWKEVNVYQKHIDSISGLRNLIQTPFLLMIAMEVMPIIVERYATIADEKERAKITSAKLYDEFVTHWFKREEDKLAAKNRLPEDGSDIKADFWAFAKKLAAEMYQRDVSFIDYAPSGSNLFGEQKAGPWEMFFSHDARMKQARRACPWHKIGPTRYAFMHASLLSYFWTKNISDETPKVAAAVVSADHKTNATTASVSTDTASVDAPVRRAVVMERLG